MKTSWIKTLKDHAERHPIVVIRFDNDEWNALHQSRQGVNEFTIARQHSLFEGVKVPAPCLILGKSVSKWPASYPISGKSNLEERAYFGLLTSKSAITTLESRAKISRAVEIRPTSEKEFTELLTESRYARTFSDRIKNQQSVTLLSPKLSSHLIERLATIRANKGGMRAVAESLSSPKSYRGNAAFQEDAVKTALAAFGLTANYQASKLELVEGKPTALGRVKIMEDSVVEHDARNVPGYVLFKSDVTGRALFHKGDEQLEVLTANRRELEHCLGVDLIYVNMTKQNVVMLQYKMLEPAGKVDDQTDWVYRPDAQLNVEINRMKAFSRAHPPGPKEYRLNSDVFYLKFVKRDAALADGGVIIPLNHFERIRVDPTFKGPKRGLRLSYRALNGRYLRQTPFLELIKCGYIGAHAGTTKQLKILIDAILDGNMAVVAAIQQKKARV